MKWEQPIQMPLSEDYWGAWYLDLDEMLARAEKSGVDLTFPDGSIRPLSMIVRELHDKEATEPK